MIIDTYYWFFSTVPQILIALVVFCGALLIYYLSKLNAMIEDVIRVTPLAVQVFIRHYLRYLGTKKEITQDDERYQALAAYREPGLVDPFQALEQIRSLAKRKKEALRSFHVNLLFSSLGIVLSLFALFFADLIYLKVSPGFPWVMFTIFIFCLVALAAAIFLLAHIAGTYSLPVFDPSLYKTPSPGEEDQAETD